MADTPLLLMDRAIPDHIQIVLPSLDAIGVPRGMNDSLMTLDDDGFVLDAMLHRPATFGQIYGYGRGRLLQRKQDLKKFQQYFGVSLRGILPEEDDVIQVPTPTSKRGFPVKPERVPFYLPLTKKRVR